MQFSTTVIWSVSLILCAVLAITHATSDVEKREVPQSEEGLLSKKRPFCNAFTGCGRKRSDPELSAEAETDLLLDKLSHQILTLVRLLEALHMRIEASRGPDMPEATRIMNYLEERRRRSANSANTAEMQ